MSVVGYPQPGKQRSHLMLEAFTRGAGGRLATRAQLEAGPAAFYGVVGIEHLFNHARARVDWFYGDNALWDCWRGHYFRFTKNAFQVSKVCEPDWKRWKRLRLEVQPWRRDGRHIVIVEQSEHFLRLSGAGADWLQRTVAEVSRHSDRPRRVRSWSRDKTGAASTLARDLAGAWALVTHMSAAANEALLAGVPVFVTGACAASPLASGELSEIERPRYPDGREEWAAGLAARQWTIEEIRQGMCWKALNA